jgi:outer membrane receptor protein involved in Fe transport
LRSRQASTLWFALLITVGSLPAHGVENSQLQSAGQGVVNQSAPPPDRSDELEEIEVTAERRGLIGTATTASEGIVVNEELALTPAYRPGQLLETVPGLVVTSHSGEGKANQYLLRGFNLDHGTNLATYVDGMPINEPTNAHGQGYTDLNFMIPELATNLRYTKGTYYAGEGDFSSVGSVHLSYLNVINPNVAATVGTLGFQRVFAADAVAIGAAQLLSALEVQHYDGPWDHPDDQRKINAVLRYTGGDERDDYSLTGMFYHGLWNSTTDQPGRAVSEGLIDRLGSLDPSDGGQSQRASVSGQYFMRLGAGQLQASAYVINYHLTLVNDFTHFLIDPANGDQEAQYEDRSTVGGAISYARTEPLLGFNSDWVAGVQTRFDFVSVSRFPTKDRRPLSSAEVPLGFSESDRARLRNIGLYVQTTTHWLPWFRSVLGLREDFYSGGDAGTNPGAASASLFQPKGSLIFTPVDTTEFYLSAGKGFHSDDLRGVNQGRNTGTVFAPLLASQTGEEIGIRQQITRKVTMTLALFNLDAQSETTYNPDIGQDTAGPASQRRGFELNATYQALQWLEIYGSYSKSHARFKTPFDDGTGHVGKFLPNAPFDTGSLAAYVKDLGPWSGGLEYRYLGAFPLSSDNVIQGSGYGEWNGDLNYAFASGWGGSLGLYNILDSRANAAEFWYIDRLRGEPAAGVADVHLHPLEPRTVRLTLSKSF